MSDSLFSEKGGPEDVKRISGSRDSYGSAMVEKEKLKDELRKSIKMMTSKKKTA